MDNPVKKEVVGINFGNTGNCVKVYFYTFTTIPSYGEIGEGGTATEMITKTADVPICALPKHIQKRMEDVRLEIEEFLYQEDAKQAEEVSQKNWLYFRSLALGEG